MMNLRLLIAEQSRFKVIVIIFFAIGLVTGLWGLFWEGFNFLESLGGIGLMIIHRLLSFCFLALSLLLVLSSIVTAYSAFFSDRDVGYLLLKPIKSAALLYHKLQHSSFYASWAFFFIIIPFIMAFAMQQNLSGYAVIAAIIYSIPFVVLCSTVGALFCLIFMRWLPSRRVLLVVAVAVVAVAGWFFWRAFIVNVRLGEDVNLILNRMIPGLRLASHPLLPGYWVSEGILSISRGEWVRGLLFGGVLTANALFGLIIFESIGSRIYTEAYQRLLRNTRRDHQMVSIRKVLQRAGCWLPRDLRSIIIKDVCTFLRDPAQWIQAVFFLGMLGLYFLNLRNLHYHTLPVEWRNLIAFLNVFSVSAVLTSLGARFVYPQLSLEGHAFWVLGLSPVPMKRILAAKFIGALCGMVPISVLLMGICVNMLDIEPYARVVSIALAFCVSIALAGFSCGLGAVFIDLKQTNPSAIVSSFGGTLNLVVSLAFIFLVMFPFAFVFHLNYTGHLGELAFPEVLAMAYIWLALLTVCAVIIPLRLGLVSLRNHEY